MYSMTGFGRAELKSRKEKFLVEISTVNNRFLEFSLRLPRHLSPLEAKVRQLLNEHLERGKVHYYLSLEDADDAPKKYQLNTTAATAYAKQIRQLQKELKLTGELTVSDLLVFPQVVQADTEDVDLDVVWTSLKKVTESAITELNSMRKSEGLAMAADMKKRLDLMAKLVDTIEKTAESAVPNYAEKLRLRIKELLEVPLRESSRLEEEIAMFADRTDITEECVRFRSHVDQYRQALKDKEAVGRRLNFILQEMNREANTMGSKSAEFGVSTLVISLKEELEKIRELVQNVE
ncbi:MAG: YicC/YloC family endoribonuclease [candidate division Zixibacteria bacterium]|nr:YicC/YloC family endoribonuclease [candidate division Zixibacteria bacterium]